MCKGLVVRAFVALSGLAAVGSVLSATAWSQTVTRLSLDVNGGEANGASGGPACSSDGRWIAFASKATDLVANDANGAVTDVFLLDRTTGAIELVSLDNNGGPTVLGARGPAVSDDGRYVAFLSDGLDPADTDFTADVYLRDRQSSTTTWISQENEYEEHSEVSISRDGVTLAYSGYGYIYGARSFYVRRPSTGQAWTWFGFAGGMYGAATHYEGLMSGDGGAVALHRTHYNGYNNYESAQIVDLQNNVVTANVPGATYFAGVSHDGRFVAFKRLDSRLIARDLASGTERDVTPTTDGAPPNAAVIGASFSDDGRYVAYLSGAANLVAGDTNNVRDAFVHDTVGRTTLRVHLSAGGTQANNFSEHVQIVADGSRVLFDSLASNLVAGDVAGHSDIFERTNCFPHALDADGDGYGAGAAQLMCVPVAPGFVPNALDCDDGDAARSPAALEICNGVDDDCDGAIDDGLVFAWWLDADGDGFGSPAAPLTTCAPPAGYVANAGDCDDSSNAIHPGALEVCNGLDDDCDGATDENLLTTYYLDGDGDGYGWAGASLTVCAQPSGYVLNSLDCDDARATAFPGAPELCNGLDDDCDANVDEGLQGAAYCATSHSTNNCVPLIDALGTPSSSASSGFVVRVRQVDGQRPGLIYYGLAPASLPWAFLNPSTLCVAAPRQRMTATSSGGTAGQCDGVLQSDVLAFAAANPGALATPFSQGVTLYFQGWLREPAMPKGTILSGGWSVTLCP
jgi:Tol biopolymer transport system component